MDIDQETTYPVMCIVLNFTKDGKSVIHFLIWQLFLMQRAIASSQRPLLTPGSWSLSNIGMKTWKHIIKQRKPGQIPMHEKAKWYEAVEENCLYGSVQNIRSFVQWFSIITDKDAHRRRNEMIFISPGEYREKTQRWYLYIYNSRFINPGP